MLSIARTVSPSIIVLLIFECYLGEYSNAGQNLSLSVDLQNRSLIEKCKILFDFELDSGYCDMEATIFFSTINNSYFS